MGDSPTNLDIPESDEQILVTPETDTEKPEDQHDNQGDPRPLSDPAATKAMDINANPVNEVNPPSPTLACSPIKVTEGTHSYEKNNKDVTVIGAGYKTPETSNVLTKHTTKEETPLFEKGKSNLSCPITRTVLKNFMLAT